MNSRDTNKFRGIYEIEGIVCKGVLKDLTIRFKD